MEIVKIWENKKLRLGIPCTVNSTGYFYIQVQLFYKTSIELKG